MTLWQVLDIGSSSNIVGLQRAGRYHALSLNLLINWAVNGEALMELEKKCGGCSLSKITESKPGALACI